MTTSSSSPQSHPSARPGPGMKAKRAVDGTEPGKKPKKVNSEIRKLQNRIASRNYREKRKHKLQYLQRLLRDQDPNDEQQGSSSETSHDGHDRSRFAEYYGQRPIGGSDVIISNGNYSPLLSSSRSMVSSVIVPISTHDNRLLTIPQPFASMDSTCSTYMYESQPQVHISSWNLPHWILGINYRPQLSSSPDKLHLMPPHTQQTYQQLPTSHQQSHHQSQFSTQTSSS
ncbi:hypothetical protein K504DRAFT_494725 [Pleomassaria siparia CBS 279.74]|uniref:BZIP domain-containing protein n=1 Tax=Pleomassaria siparia CBS 279.74 TaxID=1314801 RepID=A0A6G1JW14_9PLEO|nr:hypothetical protein K504DRAFT_494725 [Pleomassaria siparia CBS 279.74]